MAKPISVQLYSVREEASKDFMGVLKRIADIGYKAVEPAGFWNIRPSEFKKIVNDLGMEVLSSHSPWARGGNLGECMDLADALGLDMICCGYGANEFKDMDSIKATAEATNKMLETLKQNGFGLFQHNHDFEFQRLDGELKYEIYRKMCPGLKFEMDCFWSSNLGNEDPVEMLKLFANDTVLIHMKDGYASQKVEGNKMVNGILERHVDLRPLGTGDLNIKELIANVPEQAKCIVVELDFCNIDMFTALEQSYKYMTENGLAVGNK